MDLLIIIRSIKTAIIQIYTHFLISPDNSEDYHFVPYLFPFNYAYPVTRANVRITGRRKRSEERAEFLAVRVDAIVILIVIGIQNPCISY